MFKNVGGQYLDVYAVDYSTGAPKTGDANNITLYVSKDNGALTAVSSNSGKPVEVDSTNAPGLYRIALNMEETNADKLTFTGKSATANVAVVPTVLYTRPYDLVSLVDKLESMIETDTGTGTGGAWQWSPDSLVNINTAIAYTVDYILAHGDVAWKTPPVVSAVLADGVTHGGSTAMLRLGSSTGTAAFYVTSSGGTAVEFTSSGGDGSGLLCTGQGAGRGAWLNGGLGGAGLYAVGGGGDGITTQAVSITGALSVTGATTFTGAVAAANASNNINLGAAQKAQIADEVRWEVDANSTQLTSIQSVTSKLETMISSDTGTGSTSYEFTGEALTRALDALAPMQNYILAHGDSAWATAVTVATVTGSVGSVVGSVGSVVGGINTGEGGLTSLNNLPVAVRQQMDDSSTQFDAITRVTQKLETMISSDTGTGSTSYEFTEEALTRVQEAIRPVTDHVLAHGDQAWATGTASSLTAAGIADAVWDEALAGHLSAGSTGEALNAAGAAGDPWTTQLPGAYGVGSAGHLVGTAVGIKVAVRQEMDDASTQFDRIITTIQKLDTMITSDTGTGSTSYEFTSEALTRALDALAPMQNYVLAHGDAAWRTAVGFSTLTSADVTAAVPTAAQVATQVRTELTTELATIGKLDTMLSSDTGTGGSSYEFTGEALSQAVVFIQPALDAVMLHGDAAWRTASGFATPADVPTVSQIWTTALTEAYRSTGATGTAAQLLYEILQNLTEFSNVGTTKTVKKLDGSTTAKTYTYNDANNPTSITEAT